MAFEDEPLFVGFDGQNLAMRAYFGYTRRLPNGTMQPLQTSEGRDTSMAYGVIQTLRTIYKKTLWTHALWCWDHGRSSYRLALDPEYKANRIKDKETGDYVDMRPHFDDVQRLLSLLGIRHYREQNTEADDLLACTTDWQELMPILLVSGDHDLRQLVTGRVSVLKPSVGTNKNQAEKFFNEDAILKEYGLPVSKLVDLWSLTGDSGDGIPGVPRVGPATAMKILAGDEKALKKIEGYEDRIELNRKLIELSSRHASFHVTLDECFFDPEKSTDHDAFLSFLKELEMNSLVKLYENGEFWK